MIGYNRTRGSQKEICTTQNGSKRYRLPCVSVEFASYLLYGWLVGRSVGRSVGPIGWLFGWFIDWMVGS